MPRFLNRLLGLKLQDQELMFQYFAHTLDAMIVSAKTRGQYDAGILQLKSTNVWVEEKRTIHTDPLSSKPG